jgi:hypothetical protein
MAHYFEYLPRIDYDMGRAGTTQKAVDVTRRFRLRDVLKTSQVIYVPYLILPGQRPDMVAQNYYGDPTLDWLVMIANDRHDYFFEWPMDHWQFVEHTKAKYGSLSAAHQTVHHYEWIIHPEEYTLDGTLVSERTLICDHTKYTSLPANERRVVSVFDYEQKKNDDLKRIRLVHSSFVAQITIEAEKVFRGR